MTKHAYCIIAHTDLSTLQTLVDLIDDERNDIFLLLDKKANLASFEGLRANRSSIITPPSSQLIDIQWGSNSMVKAELLLFKTALEHDKYGYIHLLSGQDLPLKNQDKIHSFFESLPSGTNMIGFDTSKDYSERVKYYHIAPRYYRHSNKIVKMFFDKLRYHLLHFQKSLGLIRNWDGMTIYKGTQWVSITKEFADYLVSKKDYILSHFRWCYCPDEIYKQTMIMASPFKDTVYNPMLNAGGGTRLIDWTRGNPYVWRKNDLGQLTRSTALFARKFDSRVDGIIVEAIRNHVKSM